MPKELIHRFDVDGRHFAIDPETCFCFECDDISWDVLAHYPHMPANRILNELGDRYDAKELNEVIGELEWLRSSKSILQPPKLEDFHKQFEFQRGLRRVVVLLRAKAEELPVGGKGWFRKNAKVISSPVRQLAMDAVALLLNRSGEQQELEVEFVEDGTVQRPDLVAQLCDYALRAAKLAGKKLTAVVHIAGVQLAKTPKALDGHHLSLKLEVNDASNAAAQIKALARSNLSSLSHLCKAIQPGAPGTNGRIVIRPNHPDYGEAAATLDRAGFKTVELDLDGAFVANPSLVPGDMIEGLSKSANYYANQLLEGKYFRLDPIASLFYRIYDGVLLRRADPAGVNELAIDDVGDIYPSWRLLGVEPLRLGSLKEGGIDEEKAKGFDDVGSVTTSVCRQCWARNLCGGGSAAVHYALSGSYRKPHPAWCDAQRAWMAAAVSAFNVLSSHGVNFTRMYNVISQHSKPSLFTMMRAAFHMPVSMRPIEESDAGMLVEWENWSSASYFLFTERGMLIATRYDREMDSLHPQGIDQEMVLLQRNGDPFGLLRLRPERAPGAVKAWVYLKDPNNYTSESVRKGFRNLLQYASGQQGMRIVTMPAADYEKPLREFLEAVGFVHAGTLREALYLHNRYHNVHVYMQHLAST